MMKLVLFKGDVYLMQFSGSFLQSVLHLKRSQASQPMGGVLASPLSSARAPSTHAQANISVLRSPHGKPITLQQRNSTLSISTYLALFLSGLVVHFETTTSDFILRCILIGMG